MGTVADKLELTEPLVEVEIEEKTDEDCPVCNNAYWPCLVYKTATYSGKKAALDKLCTLNPTKKDAICQEIYTFDVEIINTFLKDIIGGDNNGLAPNNSQALSNNVGVLTPSKVKAWKYLYDARNNGAIRFDMSLINAVEAYQADASLSNYFNIGEDKYKKFYKTYAGGCNTCVPPSGDQYAAKNPMPLLHEYEPQLVRFVRTFHEIPSYTHVIKEVTQSPSKQDGGLLGFRYCQANASNVVEFEGDINLGDADDDTECAGCSYDVQLADGSVIDFKSYKLASLTLVMDKAINSPAKKNDFYKQFKGYLQNAAAQPFKYVFNKNKANVDDIKKQFQRLFADPTQASLLYAINSNYFLNRSWNGKTITSPTTLQKIASEEVNFWQSSLFNFITSF